jgi:hypothetical protein
MTTLFRSGAIDLILDCDDSLFPFAEEIVRYKGFARAEESPQSSVLFIRLRAGISAPQAGGNEPIGHLPEGIQVFRDEQRFIIADGRSRVVIDMSAHTAEGVIAPDVDAPARFKPFYFLTLSVLYLLRSVGYYAIHAAGLLQYDAAVLLVGTSDSGKSTTTLGLIRHGWHYLSDDSVALVAAADGIDAVSMRHDVCVDANVADHFPELRSRVWPSAPNDPAKWRVDPEILYPGSFAQRMRPNVLVFPHVTGEAVSVIEPLPQPIAVMMAGRFSALQLAHDPAAMKAQFSVLGRVVAQCSCFTLRLGTDALAGDVVERLLQRAASHESNRG